MDASLHNAKIGGTVAFGNYKSFSYGDRTFCRWHVLDIQGDRALIIAEVGISDLKYNENGGSVTWESCTLRRYLNEDFYNQFTQSERERILEAHVKNDDNPKNGVSGGNDTIDKIFLLSIQEAETYFKDDASRGKFGGWLRSPGVHPTRVAAIYPGGTSAHKEDGSTEYIGGTIDCDGLMADASNSSGSAYTYPVMWVNIAPISPSTDAAGSILRFGAYDWIVLAEKDGNALIITKDVVEQRAFHESRAQITWETCSLRQYLNGDFYNSFSEEEKARIVETKLDNARNPLYKMRGGKDTLDKIFVLSAYEADMYIAGHHTRATNQSWWLRSPSSSEFVCLETQDGRINTKGAGWYFDDVIPYVRPAMWVKMPADFAPTPEEPTPPPAATTVTTTTATETTTVVTAPVFPIELAKDLLVSYLVNASDYKDMISREFLSHSLVYDIAEKSLKSYEGYDIYFFAYTMERIGGGSAVVLENGTVIDYYDPRYAGFSDYFASDIMQ